MMPYVEADHAIELNISMGFVYRRSTGDKLMSRFRMTAGAKGASARLLGLEEDYLMVETDEEERSFCAAATPPSPEMLRDFFAEIERRVARMVNAPPRVVDSPQ